MSTKDKKAVILVIANNKGGVGKTALTQLLISYGVCVLGLNILGIDGDGQGNLSRRTVSDNRVTTPSKYVPPIHPDYNEEKHPNWDGVSSLASLYIDGQPVAAYPSYEYENFKIIPSHQDALKRIEANDVELNLSYDELLDVPRKFFSPDRMGAAGFDLVIADTAPALSPTTLGLIRASTHVVMPFQLEEKSCEGLNAMLHCFHEQNEAKPRSRASKMVGFLPNFTSWNKRIDQEEQRTELQKSPYLQPYLIPFGLRDARDMSKVDKKGADLSMPFSGIKSDSILKEDAVRVANFICRKLGFEDVVREKGLQLEEEGV